MYSQTPGVRLKMIIDIDVSMVLPGVIIPFKKQNILEERTHNRKDL